jgi:hypothetical protein
MGIIILKRSTVTEGKHLCNDLAHNPKYHTMGAIREPMVPLLPDLRHINTKAVTINLQ